MNDSAERGIQRPWKAIEDDREFHVDPVVVPAHIIGNVRCGHGPVQQNLCTLNEGLCVSFGTCCDSPSWLILYLMTPLY